MSNEFEIIERYFSAIGDGADRAVLGIGDDAAVVEVPAGQELVVAMDTLVGGTHFLAKTAAGDIGWKSLAVNLSDLAAMGASPAWFLLSLTLPESDADWLGGFSAGLAEAADEFDIALIGGDTCRGPLSISIQAAGLVPQGKYVTRGGARVGDLIAVSGMLGNAALGLASLRDEVDLPDEIESQCRAALERPRPRLELSSLLRNCASAAIDISDGLLGDLGHILEASGCGALIEREALPVNGWIAAHAAWVYALQGGDDYEICCTLPAGNRQQLEDWNRAHTDCPLTVIGEITASGMRMKAGGIESDLDLRGGYRHF